MIKHRGRLIYIGIAVAWFFFTVIIVLYAFFPYQKMMRVVFQNFLGGNRIIVAIEGARAGVFGARAAKITFGHEILQGKPLFEIEGARVNWHFMPLFKGVISINSTASIYDGKMKLDITNIPFFVNSIPFLTVTMKGVSLSKYPEGRLPWFKGLSGTMNGWIKKEMPLYATEKQKGSLSFSLDNGEIKELAPKNFPKLTLPYKKITVDGKINGYRINFDNLFLEGTNGEIIKGKGYIDTNEFEPKIDLALVYESKKEGSPLQGKGKINVNGNKWMFDVTVTPDSQNAASEADEAKQSESAKQKQAEIAKTPTKK